MNNREYWNRKIIEWENSMTNKEGISFVEKFASFFRGALKYRAEMSLNILDKFVRDKNVLELGCGSGYFALNLIEKCKIRHVTGIDVSGIAIARARKNATEKGLTEKTSFIESDVTSFSLPEVDVTVGLGFLDYLSPEEIITLFKNMRSPYFLFTFSERTVLLLRYIHICYLLSQRCSKHFYYTKKEIASYVEKKYGNIRFLNDRKMSFGCIVHNLPCN